MDLMIEAYRIAARLPEFERFGIADQLRRAAVSIPANIAEGRGRVHEKEYVHHLSIARGSLAELETLLDAVLELGLLERETLARAQHVADHVGRMLTRLITVMAPSRRRATGERRAASG